MPYDDGPDDPILTSRPGVKAPQGMLSEVTTKGGWQFSRSEWMDILRDAHAELRKDPNSPSALRALAEFRTAFADAVQTQEPSLVANLWQGVKDIFRATADWAMEDVPSAIFQNILEPPVAAHTAGQLTGIGNIGKVVDFTPMPENTPTWGWSVGMPGYGSPNTSRITTPEFRDAGIAEKLAMITQALPTNVPYQVTRNLFEGTGALGMLPWNKDMPQDEPVGTYETTKNVLDMATLPLGLGEAGGLPKGGRVLPETRPFPVTRGAGRVVAAAPGKIASGVKSIANRVKALYDMPTTIQGKLKQATATEAAREAEIAARADWHRARTEAQIIKNQGGTAAEQAAAKIKTDLANVRLQQAQQRLQTLQQEHAIGGRKGEVVEQQIERGPAQTEGVELSNELKRLKIQQMQGRAASEGSALDELGLGEGPPPEPPLNPRSRRPPKPKQPTPAPATTKPAATTTSVEAPKGSPAVTPKGKLRQALERPIKTKINVPESSTIRGPKEPVAPESAAPKTPPPDESLWEGIDVTPALEQVAQKAQAQTGPTRTVEPPSTKTGAFMFPEFNEQMNISQRGKWPSETAGAIQNYLDQIIRRLEHPTEPLNAPVTAPAPAPEIQAPKPKPTARPKVTPKATAANVAEQEAALAETERLKAEAAKVRARRAAREKKGP